MSDAKEGSDAKEVSDAKEGPHRQAGRQIRVAIEVSDPLLAARIAQALATRAGPWADIQQAGARLGADRLRHAEAEIVIADHPPDTDRPAIAIVADHAEIGDWQAEIRGILPLSVELDVIAAAIRAVTAGLAVLHPSLMRELWPGWASGTAGELAPSSASAVPPVTLTPRELEVLQRLAEGASNKVIARRLGISVHTAKFHVASLMDKLGAASRADAILIGARRGLVML